MRWTLIALTPFLGIAWSTPAHAWGDSGHRMVCEIAYQRLTPTARREVDRLLASNPAIQAVQPLANQFGWACTYPDHPGQGGHGRRSGDHYVNYDRALAAISSSTGCGAAESCVLTAIARDIGILSSRTQSTAERGWALVYLGHWIGDLHQPLHASFKDDEGGNEVNTSGSGCRYGLHSAWDTCILTNRHFPGSNQNNPPSIDTVQTLATQWSAGITSGQRRQWLRSRQAWQWAAESYRYARDPLTGYCIMGEGGCRYSVEYLTWASGRSRSPVRIDETYMTRAMPIIEERIKRAGVRLADVLNRALDRRYRR